MFAAPKRLLELAVILRFYYRFITIIKKRNETTIVKTCNTNKYD